MGPHGHREATAADPETLTVFRYSRSGVGIRMLAGTPVQVMRILGLHADSGWRGHASLRVGRERASFPLTRGWGIRWLEYQVQHRLGSLRP